MTATWTAGILKLPQAPPRRHGKGILGRISRPTNSRPQSKQRFACESPSFLGSPVETSLSRCMTPEDVDSLQSISRPNTASDGLAGVAHTGEMMKFVQTLRTPRFRKAHTSTELPALGFETPKSQASPDKTASLGLPSPKPPKEPRRGASQRLRSMRTWPRAAWRAALHRSVSGASRPASRISRSGSGCSQSRTTWKLKQQHSQTPVLPDCPWAEKIYHRRQVILQRRRELTSPSTVKHVQLKEVIGSAASSRRPSLSGDAEEISELKQSASSIERREKYKEQSQSGLEDDEADDDRRSPRGSKQIRKAPPEQARPAGEAQFEESFPTASHYRIFDKRRTCQFLGDSDEEEEPESSDESTSETESDDDTIEQPQDGSRVEVFYQFHQSDEIARRDLPKALEALGFMCPQEAWLAAAWKSVKLPQEAPPEMMMMEVQQVEKVDLEDFLKIVQAYENRHHLEFATAFAMCDQNGSGVVESSELADVLLNMRIEPMSHVLDEVIDEVDTSGLGTLNLDEFKSIMQLIQMREGFSKSEYEEFIAVFQRFDRDSSNECDAAELASILNWLGFAWSRDRMKAVLKEVDVDQSGSLDLREFILCMRKVREVELKAVKKAMADADADGNGLISKSEMPDLLKGLGYDPWDVHVILEAQRRAGLEEEQELELGQVWQVLTVYRRYDGFTMAQCEKFEEIFEEHCDKEGEMESIEVPKALRSLGFKITFEVVQSVIGRVDVDDTGTLSISEFRKMIRMLEERECNVYRQAFRENAKAESICVSTAQEIARKMGSQLQRHHLVFDESVDEAEIHITEEAFTRACSNLSQEMREIYRQNGGFSTEELKELQVMFDRYDSRKVGKIANKDLVRLVETVCPSLAREKSLRPQLQDMMQACQEFRGCLRFKDFLKLMRLILDFQDKERAQTEATCIKNTGFSSSEVQDFRELFLEMDEGYGVVTFESCRSMIHAITPLGDNLTHQLKRIFHIQTRKKIENGRGNTDEADFPEFLLLMKQLLDMNFAKLREKIGFDR